MNGRTTALAPRYNAFVADPMSSAGADDSRTQMAPEPARSLPRPIAREILESMVVAVILTLFIRTWILQAFRIPTPSMEPNLLVGDHLIVNKVAYSPSLGVFESWLLGKREIARGDVVVFKYPQDPSRDFIKRVIGLSGEIVEMRGSQVLVNGRALGEPYAHFRERAPRPDPSEAPSDSFGPTQIPAGELFVLGDNRDRSRDSRSWGFVPRDQIKGRALLVYWSYPDAGYHQVGFQRSKRDWLAPLSDARFDRLGLVIR